jgi:hypothetical protein
MSEVKDKALDVAMAALDRIAEHEKECGKRWSEATVEIRELRNAANKHSARWEKLAWLVVGSSFTVFVTIITTVVL